MQDSKILQTKRLYLRQMDHKDGAFLIDLHQDPEVMRYIGSVRSASTTSQRLKRIIESYYKDPGYGVWMMCLEENNLPIGWGCLKDLDGKRSREIGYRLAVKYWGKGYASEIAAALRDYGFRKKRLTKIVAVTHPENLASARVLTKTGLSYVDDRFFYNSPVKYFHIYRRDWQKLVA